ncbi:MAG: ABC transporter ATP-binding protein [Elusimicrobiaceae bacterium]|nr:ABC transporter ATP-binding protein [Elusimicrobiaceae bacterium]
MANILEIKNLTKVYKEAQNEICVLNDVSFSVEEGKFIVFIGPSGSGKTTLLNLIALLDKATSGSIIFKGEDLTKFNENQAAKTRLLDMGFVFQFDALLPEFTVLENILMPALVANKKAKAQARYWLAKFGILQLANKFPPSLSGGEKQRAALARALINKPSVLLADEPTGNLDTQRKEQIFKDFAQTAKEEGTTILMVTHDVHAANYADKCYKIEGGKIQEM